MAKQYRITPQLVSKLVMMSKRQPEKLRERKEKEKKREDIDQKIETAAKTMLETGQDITSCHLVKAKVDGV